MACHIDRMGDISIIRVFRDFSGQSLITRILALTFWCQKVTKNSAHGKNLYKRPLLRPPGASLRSGTCSSLQAFACFRGAAERTPCGNFGKYNCRITFGRSSHNVPKTSGLALDFSTVPFRLRREVTFAMYEISHTRLVRYRSSRISFDFFIKV